MNNTLKQKLVIREPGLHGHKDGYLRVIMRESGHGREFVQLLKNSDHFNLGFWKSKKNLVTYYVDEHPELHFGPEPSLRLHVSRLKDRSFTVSFNLKFAVNNPRFLVTHVDTDPLGAIDLALKGLLPGSIEKLSWEEMLNDARDFTAVVLGAQTSDDSGGRVEGMTYMSKFADRLGIHLIDISIARALSEQSLRDPNEIAEDERAKKVKERDEARKLDDQELEQPRLTKEHEFAKARQVRTTELEALEAQKNAQIKLYETLTQSIEAAVENNLGRSIPEASRFVSDILNAIGQQNVFSVSESHSTESFTAVTDQSQSNDPAEILASGSISELVGRLEIGSKSTLDSAAQQDLLAAALHLVAEGQLDQDKRRNMTEIVKNFTDALRQHSQDLLKSDLELFKNLNAHYGENY